MPVATYAEELGIEGDRLLRALALSDLVAIHVKKMCIRDRDCIHAALFLMHMGNRAEIFEKFECSGEHFRLL